MTARARSPWLATPLVAAATFLGLFGLEVMIELGAWLREVALVLALAAATVVVVRIASRSRALPSLLGAVVALVAMVPLFARTDEGGRHVLPTPGALRDLGAAVRGGVDYAATTVAPAAPDPAFTALVTLCVVALFLVAEHLAVSWRAAATAGLLLLVPWLPAVIFQHRVSVSVLITSIALWLLVLALTRRAASGERTPALAGAMAATGAALIGVLLVAPTALGGLGWGMIPRLDAPSGLDTATRLNLALDLRTSLTANSTSPVLVYSTSGRRPDAFRLYALTDFDGVQWSREDTETPTARVSDEPLWPTPVPAWAERERDRIEVQVLDLPETNLPLPPQPRTVEVDGPWFYDAERDEVVGDGVTARDLRYAVVTDTRFHDQEGLEEAQPAIDAGEAPSDPRYLEVSPAIDSTRVEDLAREVTAGATTRYDQAIALQTFFRDASQFTYDTSVDPTGGDAVSTFLDDREGYCVQFATTMVTMARTLDIPARMAVGFLSGSVTDQDTYVVQGGDAHAWPELWFPGEGWVRFEPTPAIQTGVPPAYADPYGANNTTGGLLGPGEIPDAAPGEPMAPDQRPDTPAAPAPPGGGADDAGPGGWIALAAAAGALSLIVATWWMLRRGRARSMLRRGPEGEWEAFRARLPEPLRWSPSLTPHEAAEHVAQMMRADGPGLTGSATEALSRLAHAIADHRYAPRGTEASPAQMREWAAAVLAEAAAGDVAGVATRR